MIYKIVNKDGEEQEFSNVWDLLQNLPEHELKSYAISHLEMVEDLDDDPSLAYYDSIEMLEELAERGASLMCPKNIVEEIEINKITDWYNTATIDERNRIIEKLPA